MPLLLGAFHRQQPTIAINLRVANRAEVRADLLAGEVDLVVAGRPPAVAGLVAEPFLVNPLVAIASPQHVLAGHTHVPLARLAEEGFLMREVGSGTRAAVEELFEVAGMPLKIDMVLGHIEAIKQAVAAGLGVSVLSELAVKREVQYRKLVILPVERFPIELNRTVSDAIESMQPLAETAGITLKAELAAEPLYVEGDVFALGRVYRNLVVNAIQATAPGGLVVAATEAHGDRIQVRVYDTGCGIPPERLQAIF